MNRAVAGIGLRNSDIDDLTEIFGLCICTAFFLMLLKPIIEIIKIV